MVVLIGSLTEKCKGSVGFRNCCIQDLKVVFFFSLSFFLPSLTSPTHLPDFFFQENWTPVGQVPSLKAHNLKPRKILFSNSPVSDPIEVLLLVSLRPGAEMEPNNWLGLDYAPAR